ncbi:MAG TPA: SDR family NAD(P)-dependent oxidoreductase [Streptosporangiaceae bacterium]|jgi:decaprenylphospho-beta-D-erythro-pentofuranosid-2-ulose 2-reductase|nr:SDR family NAD(P)-dependent oxidoreductase [Streptosporangiaceae bacterium]
MLDNLGRPGRVLLLGGTSEIGLAILAALKAPADTEVVLAGRDEQLMAAAGKELPYRCTTIAFEALETERHEAVVADVFAGGPVDLVIAATGVLTPQAEVDKDPLLAAQMIEINFTGHVTTLLAAATHMRKQQNGTIVVLSSVAAIRPRKANYVYGAAKAGLDAFARGLTDALAGTGVRVLLVRPGFVTGRMTTGLSPAPLSSTPQQVGAAVAAALAGKDSVVWIPRSLAAAALVLRIVPRPLWRKMRR